MNNIIVSSLTLFLVFVTFSCGHAPVVSIEIDLASRTISCLPDKHDNSVTEITSIQVKGPQVDKIIASVDEESTVTNKDTKLYIMEVDGQVDTQSWSNSYLYIKLADIPRSHFGTYACTVYYVNKHGVQKHTSTYENLDIKSDGVDKDLDNTRHDLYLVKKEIQHLTSEVRELEELSKTQRHRITELEEKGKVYAFTAYYNAEDKVDRRGDDVLLFKNVRMNRGNAYNPNTGVFTAPKKGVYLFTVTITTAHKGDEIWVAIHQNEEVVGLLYVRDSSGPADRPGDQSSKTLLLQLSDGDLVKTVVGGSTNGLEKTYKMFSVFSGVLVHTD